MAIQVGTKVRFDPFRDVGGYGVEGMRGQVTGKTIAALEAHQGQYKGLSASIVERSKLESCITSRLTLNG